MSNSIIRERSNNIIRNLTEHFTDNFAEILAESFAEMIPYCLIDLFNGRPDLNFFYLFFATNFKAVKKATIWQNPP